MPELCRDGDNLSTGHICATITQIDATRTDGSVRANGEVVAVNGDPTVLHPFPPQPPCAPHTAYLNTGSDWVFINGIKVGRLGDSADRGAMVEGSPNVNAGG